MGLGEEYDQPVQRDSWIVGFVGEIFDFRDHRPDSDCDRDLVVDTWIDKGPYGFIEFDGCWSIVAYDLRREELHALTDYLCQKPLYYRTDHYAVAVASEPDAVACLGPTTPDEIYFSAVIKWGYCPETWRTPYREICKMLPGEHIVLKSDGVMFRDIVDPLLPTPAPVQKLRQEIELAVQRRVLSTDVPVAALVSGGLDSAIVYTLARAHGGVRAYHIENDERDMCRLVAPNAHVLNCKNIELDKALEYMQEPLDLGSLVPQVALSDAIVREGAAERVCLTGDGADELFGGYGRARRYDSQASDLWHELVAWHLPRLDRVMARNLIEVRSPFLARRVVSMALALPRELRINKRVLRELFCGDLPPSVIDQPKRPLRTREVEQDPEGRSRELVRMFRERTWG